jgi:hypothetical protein
MLFLHYRYSVKDDAVLLEGVNHCYDVSHVPRGKNVTSTQKNKKKVSNRSNVYFVYTTYFALDVDRTYLDLHTTAATLTFA